MRTSASKTGLSPVTAALAATQGAATKDASPALQTPLGPAAPPPAKTRATPSSLWAGLATPVVAAVMIASLFAGPAIAQGAPLDTIPSHKIEAHDLQVRAPLADAYARLLARNVDGGRHIDGAGWGNELEGIDPLARAVYDYVNFTNPRGDYSLWGHELRGVYSEGGLGVGFTFRPKHRTGLNILSVDDLKTGVRSLDRQLDAAAPADQGTADLDRLRAGGLDDAKIYELTEALLERIVTLEEAKERKLGQGVALVTHEELLAGLEPGSDLHQLAQTVLEGKGWSDVLDREIQTIDARREAFGRGGMRDATHVDDGITHYVLLLGKRAAQSNLLSQVRAQL